MERKTYGFGAERAKKYDSDIVKALPGYLGLHQLVAAVLESYLTSPSQVLVVGAGTGTDIEPLTLIKNCQGVVAYEPEEAMAHYGQKKTGAVFNNKSIQWCVCPLSDMTLQQYGAAVMTLVLHFLPDDGNKANLLREIHQRLLPKGKLVFVNLIKPESQETETSFLKAWESYNALNGIPKSEYEVFFKERVKQINMVTETRERELWESQGFKEISKFTAALFLQGFVLEKV
jgi:tRNA (cmo5U34)-methyltransferase